MGGASITKRKILTEIARGRGTNGGLPDVGREEIDVQKALFDLYENLLT